SVVESANCHSKQMVRSHGAFIRHTSAVNLLPVQFEVFETRSPDIEKRIHHRGNKDFAEAMRLLELWRVEINISGTQAHGATQCVATRIGAAGRFRHLLSNLFSQSEQHGVFEFVAIKPADIYRSVPRLGPLFFLLGSTTNPVVN